MAPTSSVPLVSFTPEACSDPRYTRTYLPRAGVQVKIALLCLGLGLLALWPLHDIYIWYFHGGKIPRPKEFYSIFCLLFIPFGVAAGLNLVLGLPRLTISPRGLFLKSSFSTRWADWDSVDNFSLREVDRGHFRKPSHMGSAEIVGPNSSFSSRGSRQFHIANQFEKPIESIVDDLNEARCHALGVASFTHQPAKTVEDIAPTGVEGTRVPWLTLSILGVLIGIFILENVFPVVPGSKSSPSIPTLLAFGALSHKAILSGGEWYRLFTAPLLHANLVHIVSNGIALLFAGWLLEPLIGRLWFFVIFSISALGGSLASLVLGSANSVSVGASGALMGLFAALFVGSFRLPAHTAARTRLQVDSLRILFPSLIPLLSSSSAHVDYGAHLGGALTGALIAFALLKFWPTTERLPQVRQAAAVAAMAGITFFVFSGFIAIATYPKYAAAAQVLSSLSPAPQQPQSSNVDGHDPRQVTCEKFLAAFSKNVEKPGFNKSAFMQACMRAGQK